MSLVTPLRARQPVQETGGWLHRDLFRWLTRLSYVIERTTVPVSCIVLAYLTAADVSANFDGDGLGNAGGPYAGYQICNGNNGSPDMTSSPYFVANLSGAGATTSFGTTGTDYSATDLVPLMRVEVK